MKKSTHHTNVRFMKENWEFLQKEAKRLTAKAGFSVTVSRYLDMLVTKKRTKK